MIRTALTIAALSSPAHACESLVTHVTSYHSHGEFNEENPGMGCRMERGEIGYYVNSYGDDTVYGVVDIVHESTGLGVFAGMATGYHDLSGSDVTPVAGVQWQTDSITLRATPIKVTDRRGRTVDWGVAVGLSVTVWSQQ